MIETTTKTHINEILDIVKRYDRFLITTHVRADGDGIGSEVALYHALRGMGKSVSIANDSPIPQIYKFIVPSTGMYIHPELPKDRAEVVFTMDCPTLDRLGETQGIIPEDAIIINIDHHISNVRFGAINWVNPKAAATAELIYLLYKKMRVPLNRDIALLLYTGLLTDTGSFRYPNTSHLTHEIAADLLGYGINANEIYKNIYQSFSFSDMKLISAVLSDMKRDESGRIVWFEVGRGLLAGKNIAFDLTDSVLSFGRAIKGVEAVVMFKENLGVKNEIRVNFRSQGRIDVNKIAQYFGGGGHKTASGCTMRGRLSRVRNMVLNKIKEELR